MGPLSPIRWIADAVIVIGATPDLNWERVVRQAQKRKLTLMVRGALNYIDQHFPNLVPPNLLSEINRADVTFFEELEYRQLLRPGRPHRLLGSIDSALVEFWRISQSETMRGQSASFLEFLCCRWKAARKRRLPLILMEKSWRNLRGCCRCASTESYSAHAIPQNSE